MALGKKIDVEPLSDARWARIERGLFEKLDSEPLGQAPAPEPLPVVVAPARSWKIPLAAALAIAAAIALVFGAMRFVSPAAVTVVANNPSRIVTGASDSHLVLGENTLDVAPESALVVSGTDDNGVLVVMDRGKVTYEVAPRKGRPPFVVQAGGVRVRVIGTRFTVARDGDTARVSVDHGVVEVSARGEATLVRAGESWPAASKESSLTPSPTPTLTPTPAPAPAPALASASAPSRPSARPSTSRPQLAAKNDPTPPPSIISTFPTSAPDDVTPPAPPPPSPQQLFEQASKLERSDPGRALAIYRQLASQGGAWGMNALFAAGRLEFDRGNRGAARQLLGDYLARYPRGPNAADARALLDRML
jgi:hypothetical protein